MYSSATFPTMCMLTSSTALPVMRHSALPLLPRVFSLKDDLTPYDATYVALAEALNCPLVTADAHLACSPGIRCEVQLVR